MRAPRPRKAQVVQMVQIGSLLQPEKYGRGGILLMAKAPRFALNARRGHDRALE